MRYLLDTNICIYLMKRQPPQAAARFAALAFGDVGMSSITLAELRFGVEISARRQQDEAALDGLLQDVVAMPFEHTAAQAYGRLRALVRSRRRDALDRLIAAHAVSLNCTLVTNNEADFAGYPGLAVENWVAA
jgi:tRNA(fMet)-specific endonuclease VapC